LNVAILVSKLSSSLCLFQVLVSIFPCRRLSQTGVDCRTSLVQIPGLDKLRLPTVWGSVAWLIVSLTYPQPRPLNTNEYDIHLPPTMVSRLVAALELPLKRTFSSATKKKPRDYHRQQEIASKTNDLHPAGRHMEPGSNFQKI